MSHHVVVVDAAITTSRSGGGRHHSIRHCAIYNGEVAPATELLQKRRPERAIAHFAAASSTQAARNDDTRDPFPPAAQESPFF